MATEPVQSKQSAEKKKDEPRIEVREEPAEVKAEPKAEAKAEPKAEPKAAPKAETKGGEQPRSAAAPKPVDSISRVGRAEAIIRRNMLWALGAGVVPVPIVDLVAVTGVQVKMLSELSSLYEVSFREDLAKKLIGSLVSGALGVSTGVVIGGSLAKLIPVVGTAFGIVSTPILSGAATRALGKVFVMHLESGGTLLDFDPHAMRSYFKQEFEKAKEHVAEVQKSKDDQAKANKPS